MNLSDVKARLAGNTLAVCRHLLPQGVIAGHEYCVGGTDGHAGKSLKVHLTGERAGVWSDFATGEAGDLIDLWVAVNGGELNDHLDAIRAFAGVQKPTFYKEPKARKFVAPAKPKAIRPAKPDEPGAAYLRDERGISLETQTRLRLGFDRNSILFPFFGPAGEEPAMIKYRDKDDKSRTGPTSKEQKPCLFGWQAVDPNARDCWIVEGEIDVCSGVELGIPAVLSVPFGGGKGKKQEQWLVHEYDNLDRFDTIYLALDMDDEGEAGVEMIVQRLGEHRCVRVMMPHKDLNECLTAGASDWRRFPLRHYGPAELKRPGEFRLEVHKAMYPDDYDDPGIPLPWDNAKRLLWRSGEAIVVNGINGHGKSQWLGHCLVDAMSRGHEVCIFSGEMRPGKLLARLGRQVIGREGAIPAPEQTDRAIDWMDESLFLFDLTGSAKVERLLEVFEYAYRKHGVKIFAIDSLMKCGLDTDDYNGQKRLMERVCDFKNQFNVTVFIITHSRKTASEFDRSGKMDVKGDSSITDLPDTVVSVWRNKPKEADVRALAEAHQPTDEFDDQPDAIVTVLKHRNGDWEGEFTLQFDPWSLQYRRHHDSPIMEYMPG